MRSLGINAVTGLLAIAMLGAPTYAEAEIPPRCLHVISAATGRTGDLVAAQMSKLDAATELPLAHQAVALVEALACPQEALIASIDCIVAFVHQTSARPDPTDVVSCVEQATGQTLFQQSE